MGETDAEFYRGPHDGLVLDIDEIKRYCHLVRTGDDEEARLFALMPTLIEWNHIIRGNLDKDGRSTRSTPTSWSGATAVRPSCCAGTTSSARRSRGIDVAHPWNDPTPVRD